MTKNKTINGIKKPKIGDKIYVDASYHVYRGEDDFEGGLATINRIDISKSLPKDHINSIFIGIEERNPAHSYNYKMLMEEQDELKERYQKQVAHPNPDLRPEFNQPDSDWR